MAGPEDDYPGFYADVAWGIPDGLEDYTVPTKYAPSTASIGYNPWCKQTDCKTGWKTAQELIRDFTNETVAGALDQRDAAEQIFYRVRDLVKIEDIAYLSGFSAWKYRAANKTSKAALMISMARSAKLPARFVIRDDTSVQLKSAGYNSDEPTSTVDNAVLDPAAFGDQHVYVEVNINGDWVAADPAWDSQMAGVVDIAKFGEALVSVSAKGGPNQGTRVAALPDDFVAGQTLQCSTGDPVDPATYVEAMDHMTAPPQAGCRYWRDVSSPLNQFTKNVRYRGGTRDMASVAAFGIAELQEARDLSDNGHGVGSDFQLMTNAMDQLKKALRALGKGKVDDARDNFATAEEKIAAVSFLYDDSSMIDNEGIMEVRYSLALYSRQGATQAYVAFHEANPRTINNTQRIDNIGLNWQAAYGFDEEHWAYVTDPFTLIADYVPVTTPHPAGLTLGCNDVMTPPAGKGDWHCHPSLDPYIFESLLIRFYGSFQPMNIQAIDDDNFTILFNPRCTFTDVSFPAAPLPPCPDTLNPSVLLDGEGRKYDPDSITWSYDPPLFSDRGPFFNSIPVYSKAGANGVPDFFEQTLAQYMRMIGMMGMFEFQREQGRIDDLHICNRILDADPNAACMGVFAMENDIAEDTIHIMADLGVERLAFDPGNLAKATFTDQGYAWEVGRYIDSSSNPDMTFRIVDAPGVVIVDGIIDEVEAELANPMYAGKTVVVGLLSHGFPTIDAVEQAFGFPGCTDQWLPFSPYLCPFVTYFPDFADPNTFRDPSIQFPTGYVYWEDQWHRNNFDMEDAMAAEIEARIAAGPTPLALLDHNGDGVIGTRTEIPNPFGFYGGGPTIIRDTTDGLILIHNDFSEKDFDPSDRWIAGGEFFATGSVSFPGIGNSCTGGRCQNLGGENVGLPAYIKEKTDAHGPVDYVIDMPWLWGVHSSEDFHQKMTIFDAFNKGPANMIWVDTDLRSELTFLPSGVDEKPGMMAPFGDRGFCKGDGDPGTPGDGDDPNLCWGPGYDPIRFIHTPQTTAEQDFVRDAVVDGAVACFADYGNCGKLIQ
jgi:hypothetical protein